LTPREQNRIIILTFSFLFRESGLSARSVILAILCLTGCSAADERNDAAVAARAQATTQPSKKASVHSPAPRIGTWYSAGPYRVRSLVPGVFIVPAVNLPVVDYIGDQDRFCGTLYETPGTAEGKWARSRGWRPGLEMALGQLTMVNVMRRYDYQAQGCGQIDGKVILFDHGRPIAAITVKLPPAVNLSIDNWEKMRSGAVRLKEEWTPPYGDLTIAGRDIEIRPLPASDPVCRRKQAVPNVFGQEIQRARTILRSAGWKPVRTILPVYPRDSDGSLVIDDLTRFALHEEGIKEAAYCAPTGVCGFEYRSNGASLTVTTEGETVFDYSVTCRV